MAQFFRSEILPDTLKIQLPDIGDFDDVEIIEVLVAAGDVIQKDDSIITLESDKASMEIPSPHAGTVERLHIKIGERVSRGDLLLELKPSGSEAETKNPEVEKPAKPEASTIEKTVEKKPEPTPEPAVEKSAVKSHASPSVRKLARELGVDLTKVSGSGPKGRILDSDLKAFIKKTLNAANSGSAVPPLPEIDFSKFGEVEQTPLSRINKISAKHLSACWLNIPHVTQFDEADIGKIQAVRQAQKKKGIKISPLIFVMRAVVTALRKYPKFNASLDTSGENLILKKYFHIGVAVDTEAGLVVPVVRDVDKKSLLELAAELWGISAKARAGKLKRDDIEGACFTISSLGGIGGLHFTPIINAPEVAILGISKMSVKPVYDGKNFIPKPMLPLALSYDHRVIDGALGVRFLVELCNILATENWEDL